MPPDVLKYGPRQGMWLFARFQYCFVSDTVKSGVNILAQVVSNFLNNRDEFLKCMFAIPLVAVGL